MLQLSECRAYTHKLGEGSREETGKRTKVDKWRGLEQHRGFHLPLGGRVSLLDLSKTKQNKTKKTQIPCQTKRTIALSLGLQALFLKSNEHYLTPSHCWGHPDPMTPGFLMCFALQLSSSSVPPNSHTQPMPSGRVDSHVWGHTHAHTHTHTHLPPRK